MTARSRIRIVAAAAGLALAASLGTVTAMAAPAHQLATTCTNGDAKWLQPNSMAGTYSYETSSTILAFEASPTTELCALAVNPYPYTEIVLNSDQSVCLKLNSSDMNPDFESGGCTASYATWNPVQDSRFPGYFELRSLWGPGTYCIYATDGGDAFTAACNSTSRADVFAWVN
jgi:hypothetical protein